ncbi:putative 60S ribosomal protein RPL7 [Mycena leptocephala]|nr:putative 60S ribosomal protein RPL7 [Mycena leptocephala]
MSSQPPLNLEHPTFYIQVIKVPGTLLKIRKQDKKACEDRLAAAAAARKLVELSILLCIQGQVKCHPQARRVVRQGVPAGNFYVPAQPKVYFVVGIRGINEIAPKPCKIMQLLRLLQINNGGFVKVTRATQQMLRLVKP